jgi:HK97 family phage major capsid protein
MKAQYRQGARWYMNRATAGVVRKLKDAEGRHIWVDSLVLGQPSVLLGHEVVISEQMPDISAGSLSVMFANLEKAYTIIRRLGTRFLVDRIPRSRMCWSMPTNASEAA